MFSEIMHVEYDIFKEYNTEAFTTRDFYRNNIKIYVGRLILRFDYHDFCWNIMFETTLANLRLRSSLIN